MKQELTELIGKFCDTLALLWGDPEFRPYGYGHGYGLDRQRQAETLAPEDSGKLPITKRPIRGTDGVVTRLRDPESTTAQSAESLIYASLGASSHQIGGIVEGLVNAAEEFCEYVDEIPSLRYRLYGIIGVKTHSPEDIDRMRNQSHWKPHDAFSYCLPRIVGTALAEAGFDAAERTAFDDWDGVVGIAVKYMLDLEERTHYEYEVRVYLNGPVVDSLDDVEIAMLATGKQISLAYVTDQELTGLVEYGEVPGFEKINTLIRYRTQVSVEESEEAYLKQYADATAVAELIVDTLRLVRYADDVGVVAVDIVGGDRLTPGIRKTWSYRYESEFARFRPQRFDYHVASRAPLTEPEIQEIRDTINLLAGEPGKIGNISHAVSRFSRSIDSYTRSDPERIFEYSIALESLFLSDIGKDRVELQYRLCLRLARFLEQGVEERAEVFGLARLLYGFRSKLAHGGSLNDLKKEKDKEKLEKVLQHGPRLVASSILKILKSAPDDLVDDMKSLWRRVDFGDKELFNEDGGDDAGEQSPITATPDGPSPPLRGSVGR